MDLTKGTIWGMRNSYALNQTFYMMKRLIVLGDVVRRGRGEINENGGDLATLGVHLDEVDLGETLRPRPILESVAIDLANGKSMKEAQG